MDGNRPKFVEVNGRYEVLEQSQDGTVLLGPDTSAEAIMRRGGSRPMTAEEFERHFGDLRTGPA